MLFVLQTVPFSPQLHIHLTGKISILLRWEKYGILLTCNLCCSWLPSLNLLRGTGLSLKESNEAVRLVFSKQFPYHTVNSMPSDWLFLVSYCVYLTEHQNTKINGIFTSAVGLCLPHKRTPANAGSNPCGGEFVTRHYLK